MTMRRSRDVPPFVLTPAPTTLQVPGVGAVAAEQWLKSPETPTAVLPQEPDAVRRLLDLGVAADRVSSPRLAEQLHSLTRRRVDRVLVNLIPVQPVTDPDLVTAWCRHRLDDLLSGLRFLRKLCGVRRCTLVTDGPASLLLPQRLRQRGGRLMVLRRSYPQGDPSVLVYTVTGRKLRVGALPTEVGVLLLDAPAVTAIAEASRGERMTHVPIQTDELFHLTPVGTPLARIEDKPMLAGDLPRKLRAEGTTILGHGELVYRTPPPPLDPPEPCIRCGWCLDICPTHIHPVGLGEAAQLNDPALGRRYGLEHCVECGNCEAICPSRLPLLDAIRGLKQIRVAPLEG